MALVADLEQVLTGLGRARVLVVGDVMLDRYWFGEVDRISPEAPVPVVAVRESRERMGGAANVAINVSTLGGHASLLGIIGDDAAGRILETVSSDAGIRHGFVVDASAPTSLKQRIIARNQQLLRADFEGHPGEQATAALLQRVAEEVDGHDVMVLSDYGKGALVHSASMIALARERGIPVLVDPKGIEFERYRGATMVTPNLKEFEAVAGKSRDEADMTVRAERLMAGYNLQKLLVTLSERGMILFDTSATPVHSPARSREVFDVSGAGDTVIGVMAMCVATGVATTESLQVANSAAGVVVSKLGTATIVMDELRAAMLRDQAA